MGLEVYFRYKYAKNPDNEAYIFTQKGEFEVKQDFAFKNHIMRLHRLVQAGFSKADILRIEPLWYW